MADLTTLLSKFLNDLYAGVIGLTATLTSIRLGTAPADSGAIRLSNNTDIMVRNQANNGNVPLATVTGANAAQIGGTNATAVRLKSDDGVLALLNSGASGAKDGFAFIHDDECHFAGYVYNDSALVNPEFLAYRSRGTAASPSAVQADDRLSLLSGWGRTPTAGYKEVGQINVLAGANFTDVSTTWKGYVQFRMRNSATDTFIERARITELGNLLIGTTAAGTSAASVIGIANGTEPSTSPADMVQLYSVDLSAGNATLGIRTETAVATESVTSDRTLSVRINGTTYKICLKS